MDASKHFVVRIVNGKYAVWRVENLWDLSKNLKFFDKSIFDFPLDDPKIWFNANHHPTLRNIILHFKRIESSKIDHPVILCSDGYILDGMHRVAKALYTDMKFIPCVQFHVTPKPDFVLEGSINDYDLSKLK